MNAMTAAGIRFATAEDLPAVCAVVNHYIETTAANFRTEPQQPHEWLEQWEQGHRTHPWLVAEVDGEVAGISYAFPWKARAAYAWTVECAVYLAPGQHGRGLGRALYERLFALLTEQGFHSVIAGVALPNPASEGLHRSLGFRQVGTFRENGYKMGSWRDVSYWQRPLTAHSGAPAPTAPVPAAQDAVGAE
ncbi:GNAT family N-acetyltransferase [Streptomyces xiamenensis]|uniref:GNAT family N-acetyltransferase n=1 Tax=Streptomyces xiamenensis TaxID=408015 RepID=UPI0037D8032C